MAQTDLNEDDCGLIKVIIPLKLAEHLTSGEIKVENFCRICFQDSSDMVSIFEKDDEHQLSEMFNLFTSIQVLPNDGLPPNICLNCKAQIINCYEFKHQCEKSDIIWKTTITGEIICNIDKPVDDEKVKEAESDLAEVEQLEFIDEERLDDNFSELIAEMSHIEDAAAQLNEEMQQTDEKELSCKYCFKKFTNMNRLTRHQKTHVIGMAKTKKRTGRFSCLFCNDTFNLESDLHIHTAVHSGSGTTCNSCNKEFPSQTKLKRHVVRHMTEKKFQCSFCNKMFCELAAMERHRKVHTGEVTIKKHKCDTCDKRFSSSYSLRVHLRTHSGVRPYVCSYCPGAFTSPRLLKSHMLTHMDYKPYKCHYCDSSYKHRQVRDTHHRTHTGERPYVCSVCGKAFIQNSNLSTHMKTHTGEKSYKCDLCDRRFTAISSLKAHGATHSGEKPFGCDICGKRFARKNMTDHMRRHTGEKPHACSVCPKRFYTATTLRDHSRLHTGEKPFECNACHQKFTTKSYLRVHMKSHEDKKKNRKKSSQQKNNILKKVYDSSVKNVDNNVAEQEVAVDIVTKMDCINELDISKPNYVIIDQDTVAEVATFSHEDIKILPLA